MTIRCNHFRPKWTWEQWQSRCIPHSPNLQHYRNLTIRLFSVISRILVWEVLPLCRKAVSVFYNPTQQGKFWMGLTLIMAEHQWIKATFTEHSPKKCSLGSDCLQVHYSETSEQTFSTNNFYSEETVLNASVWQQHAHKGNWKST